MTMHEDIELDYTTPTPQDYGFPANPSTVNKRCWDRQELFFQAFSQLGTILHASRVVGIHRTTVNLWLSADLYSFKTRFELAHQDYQEFLEGLIRERLVDPQGNRGSDILLMFKAKAEMPEKYREEVKVLGMEGPKEMLARLKEMADRERKVQEALEVPAIEAEYREMAASGLELPVVAPESSDRSEFRPSPTRGTEDKGKGKPRRGVTRR
jgi:hypothetical protein